MNSWFQIALGIEILICDVISAILVLQYLVAKKARSRNQRATMLLLFLLFQIPLLPIEVLLLVVPIVAPSYLLWLFSKSRTQTET